MADNLPVIHPDTELRPADARVGYGVFATRPIPRGTITWVHDALDQTFSPDDVAAMLPLHRAAIIRYAYVEPRGSFVLCWDHARYNNHACRPSCRTVGDFDVAVRDIPRGGELTIEYAVVNVRESFRCACGDPHCRGTVQPDDARRCADVWDDEAMQAILVAPSVPQPLAPLFDGSPALSRAVLAAARGEPVTLPSSRDFVLL